VSGDELPPDLAALERRLAALDGGELGDALRRRVLAAVGRELRRDRRPAWQFAATAAAVALLLANLSMSAANNTDWRLGGGLDAAKLEATADRLLALDPELPEREVYRLALAAQARSRLTPAPAPPASPEPMLRRQGPPADRSTNW
jgi:hypothetical protein